MNSAPFVTKICRLCLTQTLTHFSLLDNNKISEMLKALTSITISPTDSISTVMCLKCRLNLILAYNIQQNMIHAEKTFKERSSLTLKEECDMSQSESPIMMVDEKVVKEEESIFLQSSKNDQSDLLQQPKAEDCNFLQAVKDEVTIDISKSLACDMCDRVFFSKCVLSKHRYLHLRKKCPVCGKEITATNLHTHLESHSNTPHICELCGAILKTRDNLRQHIFYSHNASRHKCAFCEKVFKKKSYRDSHQNKEHIGDATHVCDTCGKKFFSIRTLNIHIRMTHLKLRPYNCEFCHNSFSSMFAMKTHRRQHTNETPYKCEHCGEGYRQNVSLKSHLKSKHNIVEKTTCMCSVCGKGFASKVALYTHQRLH